MPYSHKKVGNKQCVYKKDTGEKVGCTTGSIKKYLAALHANVKKENIDVNIDDIDFQDIKQKSINTNKGDCDSMKNTDGTWKNDYQLTELKKQIKRIIKEMNTQLLPPAKDIYGQSLNSGYSQQNLSLGEITREVLREDVESVVVKNIKAMVSDVSEFLNKPENVGEPFNTEEFTAIDGIETKPNKKTTNRISYSSTEELSGNNKELNVIKKQGRYIAFYSISEPVNITSDDVNISDIENDQQPKENKTIIIIKVSKPYTTGKVGDVNLLVNFINELIGEYQIK